MNCVKEIIRISAMAATDSVSWNTMRAQIRRPTDDTNSAAVEPFLNPRRERHAHAIKDSSKPSEIMR